MARVAIETVFIEPVLYVSTNAFFHKVFWGETGRKKKKKNTKRTAGEKPTVNYECGWMIKNEPFKNPICHEGER